MDNERLREFLKAEPHELMGLTEYEAAMEQYGVLEEKGVSPSEARSFLEGLGYQEETWSQILDYRNGHHDVRALIIIARGNQTRFNWVLEENIRTVIDGDFRRAGILQDEPTMQTEAYRKLYGPN